MSSQYPMDSTVPPETGEDASLKVPITEHLDSETKESLADEQGSVWDFAKRNHVPTLLAVGGIVWLLTALVRRATARL